MYLLLYLSLFNCILRILAMYEVTTHESVPASSRKESTGLSKALRSLNVNQSIHIPSDDENPVRQRNRIGAICNYVGKSMFSIRIRPDRSFDVYRVK